MSAFAGSAALNYGSEAAKYDECAICFDALPERPVGQLMRRVSGRLERVCCHYFHQDCLFHITAPKHCPLCRKNFNEVENVPVLSLHDASAADAWFSYLDHDKNGTLSFSEIMDGLKAQLLLEWLTVEKDLKKLWSKWDINGDGNISKDEFLRPGVGVLAYLTANYGAAPRPPPPDIKQNKHAWFHYWDEDNSNHLSKQEVARALVKTFKLFSTPPDVIFAVLDAVWMDFDKDGSGFIDIHECCEATDNLADSIIAQLSFV
ncbi:hypothetical protein EON65_33420 [archaeon]|nr:MAG: hypothetical protein EON65_33420 [archaeon]